MYSCTSGPVPNKGIEFHATVMSPLKINSTANKLNGAKISNEGIQHSREIPGTIAQITLSSFTTYGFTYLYMFSPTKIRYAQQKPICDKTTQNSTSTCPVLPQAAYPTSPNERVRPPNFFLQLNNIKTQMVERMEINVIPVKAAIMPP
mmetsp:Transcript_45497/g.142885  ORF Transcript_45497/g.142885 Transcript_45497/m.142885 type:complete len:148 (+) Transcript_45497:784-1227(+)